MNGISNNNWDEALCKDGYSLKSDAPLFLMNAFDNGTISKFMTTDGYNDVFESSTKEIKLDCPIKSCKLLKPGCKEALDYNNVISV